MWPMLTIVETKNTRAEYGPLDWKQERDTIGILNELANSSIIE